MLYNIETWYRSFKLGQLSSYDVVVFDEEVCFEEAIKIIRKQKTGTACYTETESDLKVVIYKTPDVDDSKIYNCGGGIIKNISCIKCDSKFLDIKKGVSFKTIQGFDIITDERLPNNFCGFEKINNENDISNLLGEALEKCKYLSCLECYIFITNKIDEVGILIIGENNE